MSKDYLIEYSDRARVSYDRLPRNVQWRVDQVIKRLQEVGLRTRNIRKIHGMEDMYLGRVTADIRIIFSVSDGDITVLDIVRHDKLRRLMSF